MKKNTLILLMMIAIMAFMFGCKKAPINEKVEGHWLIKSITTIENNQTTYPQHLYYSITRDLTQLEEKPAEENTTVLIGRTEYQNNETTLILKNFVVKVFLGDNGESATREQLEPYGINNPEKTAFDIVKSTRKELILKSDWAEIKLEKF